MSPDFFYSIYRDTESIPAASSVSSQHALSVYWRGDDDLEFFTLRCRSEEQLKQWENQINRLIKEAAIRRTSERSLSKVVSQVSNSTNPAQRHPSMLYNHEKTSSSASYSQSVYMASALTYGVQPHVRSGLNAYNISDEHVQLGSTNGYSRTPLQAYPPAEGFDFEPDDEFEDYPPAGSYPTSGRGTPMGSRRGAAQSMPPERDAIPGYDRPRAHTEDTNGPVMAQWRTHSPMVPPQPPSMVSLPQPNHHPMTPRLMSNQNGASFTSDASLGPGVGSGVRPPPRGALRSQFSSTKLSSVYSNSSDPRSMATQVQPHVQPPPNRSRSASQPTAYIPKAVPPPVPPAASWVNRSNGSTGESKRGSGSSQSTGGDSSDYSPNSSSPITPFGSSESSLGAMGSLRPSRSQTFENATRANGNYSQLPAAVKVKVHFYEDIFVIQVPRGTQFNELVEKVGKKIHLCGRRRDDGPLRVKYRDEDGDLVSLGSTEDVQMAFEQFGPGGQVSLFVT